MSAEICLPSSTAGLVAKQPVGSRHPGLQLDKFSVPGDQNAQRDALNVVAKTVGDEAVLRTLFERRAHQLRALSATTWRCETVGPLTLHLSRASALENAGICLHPLYGFVYLPGSGLKGMARAFAETVWLPSQSDQEAGKRAILAVFGNEPGEPKQERQRAGSVVFHDAWPETWPRLLVDIVNCHHGKYYRGEDAPGDWEDPVPVYFLAVGPGQKFSFAVSKRRSDVPDEFVARAREWLTGALTHEGAGAKTAAGYGAFRLVEKTEDDRRALAAAEATWGAAKEKAARAEFTTTLELVTPAFLAGAGQKEEDCDLRPATLRGLLRWWWRTMHAGFVDVPTLRAMEAAVWGDTNAGGAVRVTVEREPQSPPFVCLFPFKKPDKSKKGNDILVLDESVACKYGIERAPAKTTQPLFYISYGMDELVTDEQTKRKKRRQRMVVWPGAKWRVRLVARPSMYEERDREGNVRRAEPLSLSLVLEQAKAALWLLCHFGGVGSKSRKGFGSFADIEGSLDRCKNAAREFREACGVGEREAREAESPALESMLEPVQVPTPWTNAWFVMEQIGDAAQSFAQADAKTGHGKHCEHKVVLGLPRQIHGPRKDPLPHQKKENWKPPRQLYGAKGDDRHSSPVHYHAAKNPVTGAFTIRVVAFPSRRLASPEVNARVLGALLRHIRDHVEKRVKGLPGRGQASMEPPKPTSSIAPAVRKAAPPEPNTRVEAILLEEKTKKGGWKAKHEPSDRVGPIQNSGDVPADRKPGDRVTLIVMSAGVTGDIQFRWPTQADEERQNSGREGRRGDDRRGGRGQGRR